jgi:hypothetical protein
MAVLLTAAVGNLLDRSLHEESVIGAVPEAAHQVVTYASQSTETTARTLGTASLDLDNLAFESQRHTEPIDFEPATQNDGDDLLMNSSV